MITSKNKSTLVVGMSGGVDSSVAAALLLEQGYNVIGITMKTYDFDHVGGNVGNETSCCGLDAFNDARMVAVKLGIPHYVVDFTRPFGREVIDNFVDEYLQGRTPNPCVICNKKIKWGELLKKAEALGAGGIATGHYARTRFDQASGRHQILRAADRNKDQTYALWGLSQEALSKTLFPLGELTKPEVRAIASKYGLTTADKEESVEICFVADDDYRRFLKERLPDIEERYAGGDILLAGKVVGKHQGFQNYTIGQRSGIGAHRERMYVTEIDAATNTVVIGHDQELQRTGLTAHDVNFIGIEKLDGPLRVQAMVRYRDTPSHATAYPDGVAGLRLTFDEPKRAITPGQSVVLYQGEMLIGGGVIQNAAP